MILLYSVSLTDLFCRVGIGIAQAILTSLALHLAHSVASEKCFDATIYLPKVRTMVAERD